MTAIPPAERHADDTDRAQAHAEAALARALEAQRQAAAKAPKRVAGACLNCDDPCAGLYCSQECREDYERRTRRG